MKKYTVEFTEIDGSVYEFEFITDNIEKTVEEYCRNKAIKDHKIMNEDVKAKKRMLFG